MQSRSLVHQFLPDTLPSEELAALSEELSLFLFWHFGKSSSPSPYIDENAIETIYANPRGNQLRVIWGKTNKQKVIQEIYLCDEADSSLITSLAIQAREALSTNQETEMNRAILFADNTVTGYFRFLDNFQISPIPCNWNDQENCARPGSRPFILQFSTQKSTSQHIHRYRQRKRLNEIILLLHGLLCNCFSQKHLKQDWVLVPQDDSDFESKYLYHGYIPGNDDRPLDRKGFISPEVLEPMEQIPAGVYYSELQTSPMICDDSGFRRVPLRVPSNLTRSLKIYHSMDASAKQQFLRAAHWKKNSSETNEISQSLSIFCFFAAIDSLLPLPKQTGSCEECHRPFQEGQSKIFSEFLEKYAHPSSSKLKKDLYKLRSALVHGNSLGSQDLHQTNVGIRDQKLSAQISSMNTLIHKSLVNWLLEHGKKT